MTFVGKLLRFSPALRQTQLISGTVKSWSIRTNSNSPQVENVDPDMPVENMRNPYEREKQQCILCKYKITVDYKNPRLLSQFISPFTGKIYERNVTGLCKKQQELLVREIIRSRNAGYMPGMLKKVEYMKDPKLCDPLKPVRPHPY